MGSVFDFVEVKAVSGFEMSALWVSFCPPLSRPSFFTINSSGVIHTFRSFGIDNTTHKFSNWILNDAASIVVMDTIALQHCSTADE
jgi:hypothetical protein